MLNTRYLNTGLINSLKITNAAKYRVGLSCMIQVSLVLKGELWPQFYSTLFHIYNIYNVTSKK